MKPVCTAAQTRALDDALISAVGVPGRVLMEVAGREVAAFIHARWPNATVEVWCGSGNNGGDGYVAARWLHLWGHPVRIQSARPPASDDARANAALAPPPSEFHRPDVVVDALLGTGQVAAPRGTVADAVHQILDAQRRGAIVISVDVPTGVCADTGQVLSPDGAVVDAAWTLALGRWKPGHFCAPGITHCGQLHFVDIGLDLAPNQDDIGVAGWLLSTAGTPRSTPSRTVAKWDRGHVAVRAGGGAAVLAAHGAFRGGAGLVTLLTPRSEWPRLHGLWPEVILAEPDALSPDRHDVLVLGPGLGLAAADEVAELYRRHPRPIVADADALTSLAHDEVWREPAAGPRVLTPHSAEAARLLKTVRAEVDADRFWAVQALSAHTTTVLKGPCSLISKSGAPPRVSPIADTRLATAGSGDVLAGLLGALLCQHDCPLEAATQAVLWHGQAGLIMPSMGTSTDLLAALREVSSRA